MLCTKSIQNELHGGTLSRLSVIPFFVEKALMGNENTVFTSSKLFIDARDGRIDSVRKGLKAADVDINAVDPETGRTALCVACLNEMEEVIRLLLKKQKLVLDTQDKGGATALHFASWAGNADIVGQLLAKKANPNLQDVDGYTPLHCAAYNGHRAVVAQLLQHGADRALRNKFKLTAEQIAQDEATRDLFSLDPTALQSLGAENEATPTMDEFEDADS